MLNTASSRLLCIGGLLAAAAVGLVLLAPEFHYEAALSQRPTALFVGLLIGAGALYLLLLRITGHCAPSAKLLWLCFVIGLLMRIVQFAGPPIYENDFYRYLWDGAVTAQGLDPYAEAPNDIQKHRSVSALLKSLPGAKHTPQLDQLAALTSNSGLVFQRIGYPHLSTIYPPLAQAGFAAAYWIEPFSLNAWRLVLLVAEILSFLLIFQLLRTSAQNPLWSLLYWWNPLVISEFANSAHMEPLLLPFLLAAFWALHRHRRFLVALGLALAAAVKLWPLALAPSLLQRGQPRVQSYAAVGLLVILVPIFLWPQLRHLADPQTGLFNYAADWQRNSFAFYWLSRGLALLVQNTNYADTAARAVVAVVVSGLALWLLPRATANMHTQARHWCIVIAALFLLGPTGYPWYFAWFLPFLCLWRNPALLALTVVLPLYYTRFPLTANDLHHVFQHWVVTLEFLPIWLGLGWLAWRHFHSRQLASPHA